MTTPTSATIVNTLVAASCITVGAIAQNSTRAEKDEAQQQEMVRQAECDAIAAVYGVDPWRGTSIETLVRQREEAAATNAVASQSTMGHDFVGSFNDGGDDEPAADFSCMDIISYATTNVFESATNDLEITAFVKTDDSCDFRAQWREDVMSVGDELGVLATTNVCFNTPGVSSLVAKTQVPESCRAVEFSLPLIALPAEWRLIGAQFRVFKLLDSDGDGIADYIEENFYRTNPYDPDSDDDGLPDGDEIFLGTKPRNPDTDGDGIPDGLELQYGSNPRSMYSKGDGVIDDYTAYLHGLDPTEADSDGDGVDDIDEIRGRGLFYTNPLCFDTDGDGLSDGDEMYLYDTNPNRADSDNDGLNDFMEIFETFSSPNDIDTDGDGIDDHTEWIIGTGLNSRTTKTSLCDVITGHNYDNSSGMLFEFSHDFDVDVTYTGDDWDADYAVFGLHPPNGGSTTANTLDFANTGPNTSYHNAFTMTFNNGMFRALRTGRYRFRINVDDWANINIDGTIITDDYYTDGINVPGAYVEMLMAAGRDYSVSGLVTSVGGPAKLEFARYVTFTPTDRVQCRAGFSKPFVMCKSHPNEPMSPEQHVFLRIAAKGGEFGGRLRFRGLGMNKLAGYPISGLNCDTLPSYLDVEANSSASLLISYRGNSPSASLDDVKLIAEFEEFQTGYVSVSTTAVSVVRAAMYADYDRDGDIDSVDKNAWVQGKKLRHWINTNDANNSTVDGVADLLDFVPIRLDIKELLELLGNNANSDYRFKVEGPNNAVNCLWTSLSPSNASSFQYEECANVGYNLSESVSSAHVAAVGQNMSGDFIEHLRSGINDGVFLIEGKQSCYAPLVFACYRNSDSVLVARVRMPMQISNVQDMYRWINLRSICGDLSGERTNRCVPNNFPDEESDGKHYVFVHGYNVSASSARNWGNEMFKRLWQSGSRSMFTAVDWYGDDSRIQIPFGGQVTPNYYINVQHALDSAAALKNNCVRLSGSKYIIAHSLGNMMASGAICNKGLDVNKYYMLNAAVPIEAYDADGVGENEKRLMTNPEWSLIHTRFRASHWYELFDNSDLRSRLTWKNFFGTLSNAVNFYSSEEDVLQNSNGRLNLTSAPEYAWATQELYKGVWPALLPGRNEAGWSFDDDYDINTVDFISLTDDVLRTKPLFGRFDAKYMYLPGVISRKLPNFNQVMGDGIPAESFAAGRNPIPRFDGMNSCENINMVNLRPEDVTSRWSHSFIIEGSFRSTRGVYLRMMED